MRPIVVVVGPLAAANPANIASSQSPGAGAITLISSPVTLDKARRVIFTSGGNDTGITFTITGTNVSGNVISETVTGASGAAASTVLDYLSVTAVTHTGSVATTLTIGTNGVAASAWVRIDEYALPQVALQCTASGTVNFTVQQTLDDPNVGVPAGLDKSTALVTPANMTWVSHPDAALVGATATVQGNYAYVPVFTRVLLNSGTGSVTMTVTQSGSKLY